MKEQYPSSQTSWIDGEQELSDLWYQRQQINLSDSWP